MAQYVNDVTLNSQLVGSAHIHVIGGAGDHACDREESFVVDDGAVEVLQERKGSTSRQSCPSSSIYRGLQVG